MKILKVVTRHALHARVCVRERELWKYFAIASAINKTKCHRVQHWCKAKGENCELVKKWSNLWLKTEFQSVYNSSFEKQNCEIFQAKPHRLTGVVCGVAWWNRNKALKLNSWNTNSATRWLDYLLNVWHTYNKEFYPKLCQNRFHIFPNAKNRKNIVCQRLQK